MIRRAVLEAEHLLASPGMSREETDVRCHIERGCVFIQRPRLITAVQPGDDGRDALAGEVLCQRMLVDGGLYMCVVVDESRSNDQARDVNDGLCAGIGQPGPGYRDDPVVPDADIGSKACIAKPVDDGAARQYDIEPIIGIGLGGRRGWRGLLAGCDQDCQDKRRYSFHSRVHRCFVGRLAQSVTSHVRGWPSGGITPAVVFPGSSENLSHPPALFQGPVTARSVKAFSESTSVVAQCRCRGSNHCTVSIRWISGSIY